MYEEDLNVSGVSQSLSSFQSSLESVEGLIESQRSRSSGLRSVVERQSGNLRELQEHCEVEEHALESLPKECLSALERYEEARSTLSSLQSRQLDINETLDKSMKMYDSNFLLVSSVKETFREKVELLNNYRRVCEKDLRDVGRVGQATNDILHSQLDQKARLLRRLNESSDESLDESLDEEIGMIQMEMTGSSLKLETLEKTLNEMKQQWEMTKLKSENLKSALDEENARFTLNREKWNIEWKKEDEKLEEVTRELEEKITSLGQIQATQKNVLNRLSTEKRLLTSLQQELLLCKSEMDRLTMEVDNYTRICSDLGETKKILGEKKERLILAQNDYKTSQNNFTNLTETIGQNKSHLNHIQLKLGQLKIHLDNSDNSNLTNYASKLKQNVEELKKIAQEKIHSNKAQEEFLIGAVAEKKWAIKELKKSRNKPELKYLKNQLKSLLKTMTSKTEVKHKLSSKLLNVENQEKAIQSLEYEMDVYYTIYNRNKEQRKNIQEKIEKAIRIHTSVQNNKSLLNKLQDDIIKNRNTLLQEKINELQTLKYLSKSLVDKQRETLSSAQYEYYAEKTANKDEEKKSTEINAICDIADCELTVAKSFISWVKMAANVKSISQISQASSLREISTFNEPQDMELDEDINRIAQSIAIKQEKPHFATSQKQEEIKVKGEPFSLFSSSQTKKLSLFPVKSKSVKEAKKVEKKQVKFSHRSQRDKVKLLIDTIKKNKH